MKGIVRGYMVDTTHGIVPIEKLRPGDTLTRHILGDPFPRVLTVQILFASEYIEIRTLRWTLKMGTDQKILVSKTEARRAGDLESSGKVLTPDGFQEILVWRRVVCVPVVVLTTSTGHLRVEGFALEVQEGEKEDETVEVPSCEPEPVLSD